jgi:hypothetical protein
MSKRISESERARRAEQSKRARCARCSSSSGRRCRCGLPSNGRQGSGVLGANPDTVEFDASVLGSEPERQPRCTVAFRDALGRVFVLGDLLQRDVRLEFNDASPTPGLERSP